MRKTLSAVILALVILGFCSLATAQTVSPQVKSFVKVDAPVVALTHEFNMENFRDNLRACCICPGEVATPILKSRPIPPSDEDMARMLRAEDVASAIVYVAESPQRVCLNEIVISPTWNRAFLASPGP